MSRQGDEVGRGGFEVMSAENVEFCGSHVAVRCRRCVGPLGW